MDIAERMAQAYHEKRNQLHLEAGSIGIGKWEHRSPQARAYLTEAMRRALESCGLIEPEQLELFP